MFKVIPNGRNRIDVEFRGRLDSNEMKVALDELVRMTLGFEHAKMLYLIEDFQFPSLGAIGVELSRLPELFRLIRKFDRVAVLADESWVKTVSEIEGALMPGVEIRAFGRDQRVQAEAWLGA